MLNTYFIAHALARTHVLFYICKDTFFVYTFVIKHLFFGFSMWLMALINLFELYLHHKKQ